MFFEIDQLINSFELGDSNRNRIIIRKLRKYGDSISEYLYERAVSAEDRFLSIQLLGAINEVKNDKLRKRMLNDADKEKDEFVLATFISLFRRIGLYEALPLIREKFSEAKDLRVKANCAEYLSEFGTMNDLYLLEKYFDNPSTRVSINSILASAMIAERIKGKCIQKLDSLYKSEDRVKANGALFAMKKLNVPVSKKIFGLSFSNSIVNNY